MLEQIESSVRYWQEQIDSPVRAFIEHRLVFALLRRDKQDPRDTFIKNIGALRRLETRNLQFVGRVYLATVDVSGAKVASGFLGGDTVRKLLSITTYVRSFLRATADSEPEFDAHGAAAAAAAAAAAQPAGESSMPPSQRLAMAVADTHEALRDAKAALHAELQAHRRPGHLRRHWLPYALASAAVVFAGRYVWQHPREARGWAREVREAAVAFAREHVLVPAQSIYRELFTSIRQRSGVSGDYDDSRRSLQAMIEAFGRGQPGTDPSRLKAMAEAGDMSVVMGVYERELERPLVNAVAGDLLRALLIQIQKVKVESEAAMLQMDQILRANEINIELLAFIPAALLAWFVVRTAGAAAGAVAAGRRRASRRHLQRLGAGALRAVERALARHGAGPAGEPEAAAAQGRLLLWASQFERAMEGLVGGSRRAALREDVGDLRDPAIAADRKLWVCGRMRTTWGPFLAQPADVRPLPGQ